MTCAIILFPAGCAIHSGTGIPGPSRGVQWRSLSSGLGLSLVTPLKVLVEIQLARRGFLPPISKHRILDGSPEEIVNWKPLDASQERLNLFVADGQPLVRSIRWTCLEMVRRESRVHERFR